MCSIIPRGTKVHVTDVFLQHPQDGIPAHWCVQWFHLGFATYAYFPNREATNEWLCKKADNAEDWLWEN